MDYEPQDPEEHKRLIAQRRRQNTLMLLVIGAIIIILVAFSGSQTAVFGLIGIFIIVAILVAIRGWLERRYQRRKTEERRSRQSKDLGK